MQILKFLSCLILPFFFTYSFGQGEMNLDCVKQYHISNSYQSVYLCKVDNSEIEGQIVNYVTKKKQRLGKEKSKNIQEEITIPKKTASELFNYLNSESIETLPASRDIADYPMGLDGTTYVFEIKTSETTRIYSYWEPMNDRYVNGDIPEVRHIRNILNKLENELELRNSFTKFRDGLPKGVYHYGGLVMEVIE